MLNRFTDNFQTHFQWSNFQDRNTEGAVGGTLGLIVLCSIPNIDSQSGNIPMSTKKISSYTHKN